MRVGQEYYFCYFNYKLTDTIVVSANGLKLRENGKNLSVKSKKTLVGHYQKL